MANVEKVSVALTPEMAATMRQLVATGEYASASEVMREALREWKLRRSQREQAVKALGRMWDAGIASGDAVDGEQAFAQIRARLDGKLPGPSAQ
jgi:antitoxin ParD1/3/4